MKKTFIYKENPTEEELKEFNKSLTYYEQKNLLRIRTLLEDANKTGKDYETLLGNKFNEYLKTEDVNRKKEIDKEILALNKEIAHLFTVNKMEYKETLALLLCPNDLSIGELMVQQLEEENNLV